MTIDETFVLMVDDQPDESAHLARELNRTDGVASQVVRPDEVTDDLLVRADVIAIDEFLSEWPTRDRQPLALQPQDGIAVASVLRGHSDDLSGDHPAAIVLITGMIQDMGHLPEAHRESLLASQNNLEWVFRRQDARVAARLASLADASHQLNHTKLDDDAEFARWLGLNPALPWSEVAARQISLCRPPRHRLAALTRGRGFLRWFLHRIVPYPTFLLADAHAAAACRLHPADFSAIAEGTSELSDRLNAARYEGALAHFDERRWWRSGLRALLDEVGVRRKDRVALMAAYSELHGHPIDVVTYDRPVITFDIDQNVRPEAVDQSVAERIVPDGWPPFADDAWATVEDLSDDADLAALRALRLEPPSPE